MKYETNFDLRERLLRQTTRVVRRRRYLRRAGILVACAGCYLAGLVTVWMSSTSTPTKTDIATSTNNAPNLPAIDKPTKTEKRIARALPQAKQTAPIRNPPQLPKREKKSRYESLRELGDSYLIGNGDPAGATRCYQMALRYATPEELAQESEESTWLFRALKLDHPGENHAAQNQG